MTVRETTIREMTIRVGTGTSGMLHVILSEAKDLIPYRDRKTRFFVAPLLRMTVVRNFPTPS
jgi:hypothetical protein